MIRITLAAVLAATGLGIAPSAEAAGPGRTLRPCPTEDAVYCVWDAKHMGNGKGKSFKVRRNGTVKYLKHRRAHRLLAKHDWFYDHSSKCWFHVDRRPLRLTWFC